MKIAISGKGGVGKTTFAGTLCRILVEQGKRVMAIDADPDANLASALGFSPQQVSRLSSIASMSDLIAERTGSVNGYGGLFCFNPRVDDIAARFAVSEHGVDLLRLGSIEVGGSGCACAQHALIRSLIRHLLFTPEHCLVMDMEAGIEHLGRATAEAVDGLIVVLEPGLRSIQTAISIEKLAADIGIRQVFYVANKVQTQTEYAFLQQALATRHLLGTINFDPAIKQTDMMGLAVYDQVSQANEQIRTITQCLIKLM